MSSTITFIRLNPFDSRTFGTHIATRPRYQKQLDEDNPQANCLDGCLILELEMGYGRILVCDKCGLRIVPGDRTDSPIITSLWALMTCQLAFDKERNYSFNYHLVHELRRFMPSRGRTEFPYLMDGPTEYLFWENWAESGTDLAVISPADWPENQETITKVGIAGICTANNLAAIHARTVKNAAEQMQSAFGWLYNK